MKLILAESDQSVYEALAKDFKRWGFDVYKRNTESSIIAHLKATPSVRIVVLGDNECNLKSLYSKIRNNDNYIYLVELLKEAEQGVLADAEHLPDLVIPAPINRDFLRIQLFGIRKTIELSLKYFRSNRSQTTETQRQILNLKFADEAYKNQRSLLHNHLLKFLEDLRQIDINRNPLQMDAWQSMLSRAEKMGCEQCDEWISGVIFLLLNKEISAFFTQSLLQYQLAEITENLEMGIRSLAEFGYFTDSAGSSPKNVLEGKQVLLVEDMKYNRVLLKKILQKQKCIIHEATNGEHAIEIWQTMKHVDVVIMDMNMPVMDGFQATKKIREIEQQKSLRRTPIIALTALAMRGDKELCLEAGTDDYLPKPVEAQSLIKVCRRLLATGDQHDLIYGDYIPELNIKNVLLKSKNQINTYVLSSIFNALGIDLTINNDTKTILNSVVEESYDLIILESHADLELAYFIKSNFRKQQIALLTSKEGFGEHIPRKNSDNIVFPFTFGQILNVLEYFSDKRKQAQQHEEKLADVDSLGKINRQASIDEAVQKSGNQVAVWQKAFRKIGGDLVISHQFNMHGKFGLILGDVAGHDIQSGYTASWFSGLVEGIWGQFSNPYKFLVNLNNRFAHDTEEENKRFVCSLALLWDPLREKLHFANAGIPGGILIKKDTGKSEFMDWKGVPIGMFPDMDMYDHGDIDFTAGDRLIVATDGVLEAIPREIISDLSESSLDKSAQQTLDVIVDFVTRSIEIIDDLTIAVFEAEIPKIPDVGYRQTIKSDFKSVDQAVTKMQDFLEKNSSREFDWPMISVAIREALINAVEHGNKNDVGLPVDIDFELDDRNVVVTVSDCGSGFDLSSEKKRLAKEGDLRIHGRGIEMMENIGSSVTFTGGGIQIVFSAEETNK